MSQSSSSVLLRATYLPIFLKFGQNLNGIFGVNNPFPYRQRTEINVLCLLVTTLFLRACETVARC